MIPNYIHIIYEKYEYHIYFVLAIILVLWFTINYLLERSSICFSRKSKKVVLFQGLSGSGKTSLFSRIVFNKPSLSVTSSKENEAKLEEYNLTLIDLPGADRLRDSYWDLYKTKATHVIFVVDSRTIFERRRDVGEYIHKLLTDRVVAENKITFILACNMRDNKYKSEIKQVIVDECQAIRNTRKGRLMKTSEEDKDGDREIYNDGEMLVVETNTRNYDALLRLIL